MMRSARARCLSVYEMSPSRMAGFEAQHRFSRSKGTRRKRLFNKVCSRTK